MSPAGEVVLLGAANPETVRVVRAIERAQPGFRLRGFIDNDPAKAGTTFHGYPVVGGMEAVDRLVAEGVSFVNLVTGSTRARYETSRRLAERGCRFTNLIHPDVDLTLTEWGVGNYVQDHVIVQAGARIGNNSSIHIAALIAHEATVGDSVFVAHAVSVSGHVTIEDGAFIGTNATIVPRVRIGRWATVGAGAVVIRDVPPYTTVVGNPARAISTSDPVYEDGDIFR